jgi:drug/metabolite transporter (DMT)-like permease
MFYLVLTILLNVVISAIFKLFPRYDINALQAIVVNYCVCVVTGCLFIGRIPYAASHIHSSWFPWALLCGVLFISIFNLIAYNTKTHGITTTTIANKLSLVIPVLFSIWLYHERAGALKWLGVVLAFPAVFLTTYEKKNSGDMRLNLFWPIVLFVGSGLLDTLMKYIQCSCLATAEDQATFTIYTFSVAGIVGITTLTTLTLLGKVKLYRRNIIAGICVGVPNFFSIYFLIRALNSNCMQSSATIPVINIGILVASSIVAILFFKERANQMRLLGLTLSIIAILLIALGDK